MFKSDKDGEWKYITGNFIDGRFVTMGWSKTLKQAIETAEVHDQIIVELKEWRG